MWSVHGDTLEEAMAKSRVLLLAPCIDRATVKFTVFGEHGDWLELTPQQLRELADKAEGKQ